MAENKHVNVLCGCDGHGPRLKPVPASTSFLDQLQIKVVDIVLTSFENMSLDKDNASFVALSVSAETLNKCLGLVIARTVDAGVLEQVADCERRAAALREKCAKITNTG